jgi:DDE superfamily endonuclease
MLPVGTVPASLLAVLEIFRTCFTTPSFTTFTALVTGMIAQTGRRTVTGMLTGARLSTVWPHDRVHRFFSRARWDVDRVGLVLASVIVSRLTPPEAAIGVAVDDTLFKRYGKKIFGAAWQYDGAATGPKPVGRGTCFVVVCIVVDLPFMTRPVALPVLARLWRPKQDTTKIGIAAELVGLLAAAFGGRRIDVVADGAYHGKPLRNLPTNVSWTCRIPTSAVLYELAPPYTGRGRPRLKGERFGTVKELAMRAVYTTHRMRRYDRGVEKTVRIAEVTCLWYGSFHARTVRVIFVRNDRDMLEIALVTTDLNASVADLVQRYAARWSIEVTFEEARQHLGVGQAENRTRAAVERTIPFGLYVYAITVVWYALYGYHPADVAEHRARSPWYGCKTAPSFQDMLVKLRRTIIAARFIPNHAGQLTDHEITTVRLAWAAAAA